MDNILLACIDHHTKYPRVEIYDQTKSSIKARCRINKEAR